MVEVANSELNLSTVSYYWTFLCCPQTYKVSKNLIGLDFKKCPVVWPHPSNLIHTAFTSFKKRPVKHPEIPILSKNTRQWVTIEFCAGIQKWERKVSVFRSKEGKKGRKLTFTV